MKRNNFGYIFVCFFFLDTAKDLLLMCSTPKCDNSQLPSLMESDDSETDENFEEFLMEERNNKEFTNKNKCYSLAKYVYLFKIKLN